LRALERAPVAALGAVGEHRTQDARDALFSGRFLQARIGIDAAVGEDGVGDLRGAYDQRDAVRKLRADRRFGRRRDRDLVDQVFTPRGQLGHGVLRIERLLGAALRGRGRPVDRRAGRRRERSDDAVVHVEVAPRDAIDVGQRDLRQQFLLVRDRRFAVEGDGGGPVVRQRRNRVAAEFLVHDRLAFRRLEEFGGNAVRRVTAHDRFQAFGHVVGIRARFERGRGQAELTFRKIRLRIPLGIQGLAGIDQRLHRTARRAEHFLQEIRGQEVGAVDARHAKGQHRQRVRQRGRPPDDLLLQRAEVRDGMRRDGFFRNRVEIGTHLGQHRFLVDVAGDDQHGVVGRVPAIVKLLELRSGQPVEVGDGSDALPRVGRTRERERLHVAEEVGAGGRLVAQHLLLDGAALVLPLGLQVEDVAHAVGLDAQDRVEIGSRDGEFELGQRVRRFGVEIAAEGGRDRPELTGAQIRRAAEHHVLLGVRHALYRRRIVTRADAVRHVGRYHRGQRVAHDDHPQTVGQGGFEHVLAARGGGEGETGRRDDGREHEGEDAKLHQALSPAEHQKTYRKSLARVRFRRAGARFARSA